LKIEHRKFHVYINRTARDAVADKNKSKEL